MPVLWATLWVQHKSALRHTIWH